MATQDVPFGLLHSWQLGSPFDGFDRILANDLQLIAVLLDLLLLPDPAREGSRFLPGPSSSTTILLHLQDFRRG